MKWPLVILLCLFSVQQMFAQDQLKIDSLQIKLNNAKEDTTRIKILLELSDKYSRTDFLKALEHAKKALELSIHIENKLYIVRSHILIGNSLLFLGKYDESMNNFLLSLKLARENNFEYEQIVALSHLGIIQDRIQKFDEALKYYFDALNIFNKSIEQGRPIKELKNIQSLYNNIGNIYSSKKDPATGEKYYLKGLALAEQKDDDINIGVICNNLGKLGIERNDYPTAYKYLMRSLHAREKINDKSGMARSYNFLASYYQATDSLNQALEYSKKALDLGTEIKDQLTIKTAANFLYEIYKKQGKIDKALEYHELYKQSSDSLINDSKIEEITRLQLQYEYDNLEKERDAKQQIVKYTYIIIVSTLILGLIILGLLFFLAKSRNKRIHLEKEKLEKDMVIKNKELTTNVLYLLQKNELIINITSRLLKLKDKLKEENVEPVQRIIYDLQSLTDKEVWKEFEVRFQDVHEEFYQKLKDQFPDLSPSEIKLAAFLRLNMTTKEIASITGQSINSLEVARYRLRKKLGLTSQEVNLVNFLLNI
jgi:tetratricopeptide (TPR) repeat protein